MATSVCSLLGLFLGAALIGALFAWLIRKAVSLSPRRSYAIGVALATILYMVLSDGLQDVTDSIGIELILGILCGLVAFGLLVLTSRRKRSAYKREPANGNEPDPYLSHQPALRLADLAGCRASNSTRASLDRWPPLDVGHKVQLLDVERRHLEEEGIEAETAAFRPEILMTGHSGSTPAHSAAMIALRAARRAWPGGAHCLWRRLSDLSGEEYFYKDPSVDIVVRIEDEAVVADLVRSLVRGQDLDAVRGVTYRRGDGTICENPPAPVIAKLDEWRVDWELVADWDLYQCYGLGRAAIVQFSRGCPHQCSYCGQFQFWSKWRYRAPRAVAAEIAWLHRQHGVNFVDLADENPTSSKRLWREFLQAMADENVPVRLFAIIRAADIVRDADLLPLMKLAGMICVLIGVST